MNTLIRVLLEHTLLAFDKSYRDVGDELTASRLLYARFLCPLSQQVQLVFV